MKLDGEGYLVVGVMPATFKFAPFWAVHVRSCGLRMRLAQVSISGVETICVCLRA